MFVRATDKYHISLFGAHKSRINIAGNIYSRQVSNMDWPISVGQGGSDCISFYFFRHQEMLLYLGKVNDLLDLKNINISSLLYGNNQLTQT